MGQYYRGAILNEDFNTNGVEVCKSFNPYSHDNGAKLMEHSYVSNYYVKEYENALANDFYGMPFVWVGDYADEFNDVSIYDKACKFDDEDEKIEYDELPTYKYIINFDKHVFVKIPNIKKGEFIIHPLPLLCADGNGRGGGDYDGTNMELVGAWAFDRIGVSNELPNDITKELIVTFEECYDGGDNSVNDYTYSNF